VVLLIKGMHESKTIFRAQTVKAETE